MHAVHAVVVLGWCWCSPSWPGLSGCAQFFDVVDADHSGEIDVHELQRALALGDLNFSLSIVAHMIRWGCPPGTRCAVSALRMLDKNCKQSALRGLTLCWQRCA